MKFDATLFLPFIDQNIFNAKGNPELLIFFFKKIIDLSAKSIGISELYWIWQSLGTQI